MNVVDPLHTPSWRNGGFNQWIPNFTREYAVFLEVLINARKRQGLTQQALADLLNKPQSFVSKYESGERRLDVVEFCQLAKVIGQSPAELLQEMGFV